MSVDLKTARFADGDLVDALVNGDEAALDTICGRYRSGLQTHIRRLLGPGAPIEEIAQDVFIRFWATAARFDPERGSLGAYLHLIARGKALDWVRSEAARRQREENYRTHPETDSTNISEIRIAVDSLPAREHRAIWLAYYVGFTYRQVATILEIPEGTAKAQLRIALKRLHGLLHIDAPDVRPGHASQGPAPAVSPVSSERSARGQPRR